MYSSVCYHTYYWIHYLISENPEPHNEHLLIFTRLVPNTQELHNKIVNLSKKHLNKKNIYIKK